MNKLTVTLQDTESDRYKRMFEAACVDLGRINACLGLDPDDGGAEPIIQNQIVNPLKSATPMPDVVRDLFGKMGMK